MGFTARKPFEGSEKCVDLMRFMTERRFAKRLKDLFTDILKVISLKNQWFSSYILQLYFMPQDSEKAGFETQEERPILHIPQIQISVYNQYQYTIIFSCTLRTYKKTGLLSHTLLKAFTNPCKFS